MVLVLFPSIIFSFFVYGLNEVIESVEQVGQRNDFLIGKLTVITKALKRYENYFSLLKNYYAVSLSEISQLPHLIPYAFRSNEREVHD